MCPQRSEVAMKADQAKWLERNAVTCRVFKGRWSVRHCVRMYNDIKDLKIQMSSRGGGQVTRYQSAYNPCERCRVLSQYFSSIAEDEKDFEGRSEVAYPEVMGF